VLTVKRHFSLEWSNFICWNNKLYLL